MCGIFFMPETKLIPKIKDIIYIGTILVAIAGFLINEGKNRQKQEDIKLKLEKIDKLMEEQLKLNGQIIMYMRLDSNTEE